MSDTILKCRLKSWRLSGFVFLAITMLALNLAAPLPAQDSCVELIIQFGTSSDDGANGVAVDSSGNIYVIGDTLGTFPGQTSLGGRDAFIRKYTSAGSEDWTIQFGTSADDYADGVAVDSSGNIYVIGETLGTLPGQTSLGGRDAFIRKYTSAGSEDWTIQFGTSADDYASGIAIDSSDATYICGYTYGEFPGKTKKTDPDGFMQKYNSSGTSIGTIQFAIGTNGTYGVSIALDSVKNGYIGGTTDDGGTLYGFIKKYISDGTSSWYAYLGDGGGYVTVNSVENIYLSAYDDLTGDDDVVEAKYNKSNGDVLWSGSFGTSYGEQPKGISVDSSDNIYVTGNTLGVFPSQSGFGGIDGFLHKHTSDGSEVFTYQFGTSGGDYTEGIALDSSDKIYVAGYTEGAFSGQVSSGGKDAFILKFAGGTLTPSSPSNPSPADEDIDVSTDVVLDWDDSTDATSYDVYFGSDVDPSFAANVASSSYDPGLLETGETYYWKIVARNQCVLTAGPEWSFTTVCPLPSAPGNPSPLDGATDVSTAVNLDWDDSAAADSYDVYFGASTPPPYITNVTSSSYDPGPLNTGETYYWKIVARNACGDAPGPEWSFTTSCPLPSAPSNPAPSDAATDVSTEVDLDWDDSAAADSYDVYFGTTSPPPYITNVTGSSYDPGTLNIGTTYHWKIVASNTCGDAPGPEWSFTTSCPLPSAPSNPAPSDAAADVSTEVDLDWDDSAGADSYDVYFGTTSPPPYVDNVTNSSYDPGTLDCGETYYWKIGAKNTCGEIPGDEWDFTTESCPKDDNYGIFQNNKFYLDTNWDGQEDIVKQYGKSGDIPVTGDWDGNGITNYGIYRGGKFFLDTNWDGQADIVKPYGKLGDIPITGDWDGDGITNYAIYRGGKFYLDTNWDGMADIVKPFGKSGDIPITGDWDGM